MKTKFTTLASAASLSVALAGCGHSEIDTVKAATVPQDSTHTYETALSNQTGVQQERSHFEQQEKDTFAQIDKTYGDVTNATEVFQWYVKDDARIPSRQNIAQLTTGAGVSGRVIALNVFAMAIWTVGVFASLYAG